MPDEATGIAPPTVQLASLPEQWRGEAEATDPGTIGLYDADTEKRRAYAKALRDCAQELQAVLSISPRGCWEHPGVPGYSHPECGFCWHGKDGLDVPGDRIEGPTCPRCYPQPPAGQATVSRDDLEYVLAHVADEIHGNPAPAHWNLPLFREALARLHAALAGSGAPGGTGPVSQDPGDGSVALSAAPETIPLFDITPEGTPQS